MDIRQASGEIQSRDDYKNTPSGQYKYWEAEMGGADANLKDFLKQGDRIVSRFLGETGTGAQGTNHAFLLNIFHANVTTLISTLYGSIPTVDVSRRYADSTDDVGRVAGEIMERLLNSDFAVNGAETETILRTNLQDRLIAGLGVAKVRYEAEFEEVDGVETATNETAVTDYVHWRDVRWGWARTFKDVPWIGFRSYLSLDEAKKRFGEIAEDLSYKAQKPAGGDDGEDVVAAEETADVWQKAEVWEIWDKRTKEVVWWSKGCSRVLDTKPDPLQLTDFYPCPSFFMANTTSTLYVPRADFTLAQDLYNEVDKLQTRIAIITEAVRVVGVYDAGNEEVGRMLNEGVDNDLIPVDNWALFAEKGGIQGSVDWFPIADVVAALKQLIEIRDQTLGLLQQITGMSDLMRGELSNQYEGVGQTQMKAQFGSVRIQALQDEFAGYASALMRIKAEVIARHCSPEAILKLSNAEYLMEDQELIQAAIMLIKDPTRAGLAVKIRPESIAMVDYAALKNERAEFINALATFMQSAGPLIDQVPESTPFLLQLLQWGLAGFKGASEIEGVIDKAIEDYMQQQAAQQGQEQEDPELAKQRAQNEGAMQLEQLKTEGQLQVIQAKSQADLQNRQADMHADAQTLMLQFKGEMEARVVDMNNKIAEIQAKMEADLVKEQAQTASNIAQTTAAANSEVEKDAAEAQIQVAVDSAKTDLKLEEIAASAEAKTKEAKARVTQTAQTSDDES